ncbi:histone-lysine N-methyltransferase 2C-like [Topomyia yanbarensis]|uniref:histone-lysine N-methyltransferase 2C-like n=1 Tax=Topomyia yanbarensis TaxID=2498891 RepID=UPI00273C0608|nr:histone-lysine N-methyltransferase 2C-like [Topomyia yanbarensis]
MDMHRRSIVRQTRSVTKAMAKAAKHNLANRKLSHEGSVLYDASFKATVIDTEHGNEHDCASCDRSNNAEWYMVQCKDCDRWYHFTCAKVDTATVQTTTFSCILCVPRIAIPALSSVMGQSSRSSARKARIDRELERLEEEKRLLDEMEKERFEQAQALLERTTQEKLERTKQYIAKKYDLRSQQDEEEVSSERSCRTHQSNNRVGDWIETQMKRTEGTSSDPVDIRSVKLTSTPLVKGLQVLYYHLLAP